MKAAVLVLLASICSYSLYAQNWEKSIEDIDAAYRIGDYQGAAKNNTKFEYFETKIAKKGRTGASIFKENLLFLQTGTGKTFQKDKNQTLISSSKKSDP